MALERFKAFLKSLEDPKSEDIWAPRVPPTPLPPGTLPTPPGTQPGMPPPKEALNKSLDTNSLSKAIEQTTPTPPPSMPESPFLKRMAFQRKVALDNQAKKGRVLYGDK